MQFHAGTENDAVVLDEDEAGATAGVNLSDERAEWEELGVGNVEEVQHFIIPWDAEEQM